MNIKLSPYIDGRPATTDERALATLERLREDAKWREYDVPTYIRKGRAVPKVERLPILLLKQAS